MRFEAWEYPPIEEGVPNKYGWIVRHREGFVLGYKTDIGAFTYVNARHGVVLEDFVQIGSHCALYSVSTIDGKEGPVRLKRNCRIGTHSVVMPNVTIGENAIVGAFSYVTTDIPANVVAFGVPARVVRELTGAELAAMEKEAV